MKTTIRRILSLSFDNATIELAFGAHLLNQEVDGFTTEGEVTTFTLGGQFVAELTITADNRLKLEAI